MENSYLKPDNLRDIIKKTQSLSPIKESITEHVESLYSEAIQCWEEEDLKKANELIDSYNSYFESDQIGNLIKLSINLKINDTETSLSKLKAIEITEDAPTDFKIMYYFLKGALLLNRFDVDEARNDLSIAIKLSPKFYILYYLRAICYSLRFEFPNAIADYKIALKEKMYADEIKANLAYAYLRKK